jgi:predicted RNase H-like nuclease (RuvC/YqgF family)
MTDYTKLIERNYFDSDDNPRTLNEMVKLEPGWAANRIREGEKAIAALRDLTAEVERLKKRNCDLLTYCEKLDENDAALQDKIEKMEQAIGYVMRAWHHDRLHLPWSIHKLKKAYPEWKDRYPHHKAGA